MEFINFIPTRWWLGLAADVVYHPVDPLHVVNDLVGDICEKGIRQMRPVRHHVIHRSHRPQGHGKLIGPLISHDPYTLYRKQDSARLPYGAVEMMIFQRFNIYMIYCLQ
jgi:hypothetical protein